MKLVENGPTKTISHNKKFKDLFLDIFFLCFKFKRTQNLKIGKIKLLKFKYKTRLEPFENLEIHFSTRPEDVEMTGRKLKNGTLLI